MQIRTAPVKDWTVLVYNAGQADEGMMCTRNLLDLEKVGSDEHTDVVCQNYRSAWWPEKVGLWHDYLGSRTYHVEQHAPENPAWQKLVPQEARALTDFATTSPAAIKSPEIAPRDDDANMGEAATLKKFLVENIRKYPAKHYAVILSGHGAGFAGQAMVHNPDARILNQELGQVLKDASAVAGHKIDLVNLNTCYGSGLEVFHPLREGAQTAVSSQGIVFGGTQPLGEVLADLQHDLKSGQDVSGAELAQKFVEHARYQSLTNLNTATLSAVDLSKIDGVAQAVAGLHQCLLEEKVPPEKLAELMQKARRTEYSGIPRTVYVQDIGSFADLVQQEIDDPKIKAACQKVTQTLSACVLDEQHADHSKESPVSLGVRTVLGKQSENLKGLSGLSIYYDNDVNARGSRLFQVKDTELGKQVDIEKFLKYVSGPADARRSAANPLTRKLENFTYDKRIFEYKLDKKVSIPFVLPVLKRIAKTGAMLGASAALGYLGLPMNQFWGAYFAYQGAEKIVKAGAQAFNGETGPVKQLQLADNLADATMGACLGSFGLSLMGALPHSVVMPAVGIAVAARAARYLGKVAINEPYNQAYQKEKSVQPFF